VGSGITPVLSIVATVLGAEPDSHVTLLYGSRSTADVMFLEDLEDLKNAHAGRFMLLHFLSREPQTSPLRAGRLDGDRLDHLLGPLVDPDADDWYLCGPAGAVEAWRACLLARGVATERVHRELFHVGPPVPVPVPVPRAPSPVAAGALSVTLDGRTTATAFSATDTVLDAVLRVRPEAPFACRGGVCGTCRAMLVDGEVAMDANFALEADELGRGFVLTCQARPITASVTLDFDR
jgi:ring-1,2-phenylacetyl-CoA epoxidase subunit PaaE